MFAHSGDASFETYENQLERAAKRQEYVLPFIFSVWMYQLAPVTKKPKQLEEP